MSVESIAGLSIAIGLLGYLVFALLFPEKF
ncbi:K(+)-transporting ATPase subunit F [Embleya sp. AB8]